MYSPNKELSGTVYANFVFGGSFCKARLNSIQETGLNPADFRVDRTTGYTVLAPVEILNRPDSLEEARRTLDAMGEKFIIPGEFVTSFETVPADRTLLKQPQSFLVLAIMDAVSRFGSRIGRVHFQSRW